MGVLTVCRKVLRQWLVCYFGWMQGVAGRSLVPEGCSKGSLLCLSLRKGLKHSHAEFGGGEGVEAFAYPQNISLGIMGVTAIPFLRRGLDGIGIVANPAKAVALPVEGSVQTAEDNLLLASFDIQITEEGGLTVTIFSNDTDEHVSERRTGAARDKGADFPLRCLAGMPDKQAADSSSPNPRTENQLPRLRHRHGYALRSMQQDRKRGALGL